MRPLRTILLNLITIHQCNFIRDYAQLVKNTEICDLQNTEESHIMRPLGLVHKYTLYGICYTLYVLLSATEKIPLLPRYIT